MSLKTGDNVLVNGISAKVKEIGKGKFGPTIKFDIIDEVDQHNTWGCRIDSVEKWKNGKFVKHTFDEPHTVI